MTKNNSYNTGTINQSNLSQLLFDQFVSLYGLLLGPFLLSYSVFRWTLLSRPNKVGLKCLSIHPYVRTSTKRFFDCNEFWHVGRGR